MPNDVKKIAIRTPMLISGLPKISKYVTFAPRILWLLGNEIAENQNFVF
jgi:hypothetical protein